MVSFNCDIVFVTDFDFVLGVFVIGLIQLLSAKNTYLWFEIFFSIWSLLLFWLSCFGYWSVCLVIYL